MNTSDLPILRGDGTWPWSAYVDGADIVMPDVVATCFGGDNDAMDNGETASGIRTKGNPQLRACALPMIYSGRNRALLRALGGSPIPKLPWKTRVVITSLDGKISITVPVIDLGPAKRTGNAVDLTIAAARKFQPKASANNFKMRCHVRIPGGAGYLTKGSVS